MRNIVYEYNINASNKDISNNKKTDVILKTKKFNNELDILNNEIEHLSLFNNKLNNSSYINKTEISNYSGIKKINKPDKLLYNRNIILNNSENIYKYNYDKT